MHQGLKSDKTSQLSYYLILYAWCLVACPILPYALYVKILRSPALRSNTMLFWHSLHAVWLASMVIVFFGFFSVLSLVLEVSILWHVWTALYLACVVYACISLFYAARGERFCLPFLLRWLPQ
ncbi:MAG: hypothetical protein WC966_08695 [Bradymonadales bacterium]